MIPLALITFGLLISWVALWVEQNHYSIWSHYKKDYKKRNNSIANYLFRPNYFLYRFQIYVLWPLILAAGVAMTVVGILWPFL